MAARGNVPTTWLFAAGLSLGGIALVFLVAKGGEATAAAQPAAVAPLALVYESSSGTGLRVELETTPKSIPVGVTHAWFVTVSKAGAPISGCQIAFDGSMPEHGHGLPTAPKVDALATPGRYRVDGVRFSMPGYWRLEVDATCAGSTESASFDLRL